MVVGHVAINVFDYYRALHIQRLIKQNKGVLRGFILLDA